MQWPLCQVYVFKSKGEIVGVSMWSIFPTKDPRVKVIYQGKLRIAMAFRQRGLHVEAVLRYYFRRQFSDPLTTFWFLSIASVFNYVSARRQVGDVHILNKRYKSEQERKQIAPIEAVLVSRMEMDNFQFDPENGAIYVHVYIAPSTFDEFPASYMQLPEAKGESRWACRIAERPGYL